MSQHNISTVAHLIAEPVRAVILITLADGCPRPAGALADAAGVTAQTASSHLSKLLDGGLLRVESKGRHRYYSLAGPHIPRVLESLASVGPVTTAWRSTLNRSARELRFARCCYDHLAGRLGVAVTDALQQREFLVPVQDRAFNVTPAGATWFGGVGVDVASLKPTRRGLARQCLDWTERTHHLAGPLGAAFMSALCQAGWLRRSRSPRGVEVTLKGRLALKRELGVDARPEAL